MRFASSSYVTSTLKEVKCFKHCAKPLTPILEEERWSERESKEKTLFRARPDHRFRADQTVEIFRAQQFQCDTGFF